MDYALSVTEEKRGHSESTINVSRLLVAAQRVKCLSILIQLTASLHRNQTQSATQSCTLNIISLGFTSANVNFSFFFLVDCKIHGRA